MIIPIPVIFLSSVTVAVTSPTQANSTGGPWKFRKQASFRKHSSFYSGINSPFEIPTGIWILEVWSKYNL